MRNFRMCLMALATVMAIFGTSQGAPGVPPLISFQDGKIGVNFLGFHAAAGLGGGAGQGGAAGGLHAEAGTPFGQRAAAGLRGNVGNEEGQHTAGELYAGATAGGNIKAAAGIGGTVLGGDQGIAVGKKYAVASAPGVVSGVSENGYSNGVEKAVEKSFVGQPPVQQNYGFQASVQKGYSGGFNQEAQHQGTFVQKEYSAGSDQAVQNSHVDTQVGQNDFVVVKTKEFRKKHVRPSFRKHVRFQLDSRYGNEQEAHQVQHYVAPLPPPPPPPPAHYHTTVEKRVQLGGNANGQSTFFADIFNIPISALGAVSKFLSNSAQHAGNFQVQKNIEVRTHH